MISRLSIEQGTVLVRLARKAIEYHFAGKPLSLDAYSNHSIQQKRGVFVTLLDEGGSLRGCIGNPFPGKPLADQTAECAIEAASMDPRFDSLEEDELGRIIIEVTILSPIEPIEENSPVEIPSKIVTGRHGLLVEGHGSRGLLLPQVAVDEDFDAEEFLCQCCIKAGMMPDGWMTPNVRISRFEGQIFSERIPKGPVFERTLRSAQDRMR